MSNFTQREPLLGGTASTPPPPSAPPPNSYKAYNQPRRDSASLPPPVPVTRGASSQQSGSPDKPQIGVLSPSDLISTPALAATTNTSAAALSGDYYAILERNCLSDTARQKGINDKSLFFCLCFENPFRSSEREPEVDEELFGIPNRTEVKDEAPPIAVKPGMLAQGAAAATPSASEQNAIGPNSPSNTNNNDGTASKEAEAKKKSDDAFCFLQDDDLIAVPKRKSLFSLGGASSKEFSQNEPLTSPLKSAAGESQAGGPSQSRPVPNNFQKIIEIVWRLTQRGIQVYPPNMIQRLDYVVPPNPEPSSCPPPPGKEQVDDGRSIVNDGVSIDISQTTAAPPTKKELKKQEQEREKERKRIEKAAKALAKEKKEFPNLYESAANSFYGMKIIEDYCYLSPDKDEIYIKIHAESAVLLDFASKMGLPLISHEFSPGGGSAVACTEGIERRYTEKVSAYAKAEKLGFPKEMKGRGFHFDAPHKMRMMDRLLREPWEYGGCGLQLNEMIGTEVLLRHFFPMHNRAALVESGISEWGSFRPLLSLAPLDQDENALISYFGEDVALYFLWVREMTFFLRWLAVPGIITGVFSAIDFYKSVANGLFAMCCVVWGGCWCIYWARRETEFSTLYCQEEQSAQEIVRDEFHGESKIIDVADVYELNFSYPLSIRVTKNKDGSLTVWNQEDPFKDRRRQRYLFSYPIILLITLTMIAVLTFITWYRFQHPGDSYVSYGSSAMTSVVSAVFGFIFTHVIDILNHRENLRTLTDKETQTIQKSFIFNFFSAYFALFIIALYPLPDQSDSVRLKQLESQMVMICLVNPMVQNITQSVAPYFLFHWRLRSDLEASTWMGFVSAIMLFLCGQTTGNIDDPKETDPVTLYARRERDIEKRARDNMDVNKEKKAAADPNRQRQQLTEVDAKIEQAAVWYEAQLDPFNGTSDDYLQITLQFGFMAMAASTFPWAAVSALFYNMLELRIDAIKMIHFSRRPLCRPAQNIGPWRYIFVLLTIFAVITNAYIVFIIGDTVDEMQIGEAARWKAFIVMQYIAIFCILSVFALVGTHPVSASKIKAKRAALSNRAFQKAVTDKSLSAEDKIRREKMREREAILQHKILKKMKEDKKRKEEKAKRAAARA